MDGLQRSHFLDTLSGQVFLSHFQAMQALAPDLDGLHEPGQAQGEPHALG